VAAHSHRLLDLTGAEFAAVTLDTDGALVCTRNGVPYRIPARPRPHSQATGAGDTFVSGLTLALAVGASPAAAAEIAAAAAALVVTQAGTVACPAAELRAHFALSLRRESRLADARSLPAPDSLAGREWNHEPMAVPSTIWHGGPEAGAA
jgi:D-beta-D-heptose 7-phosphate kinase/D-beta-D-heptose 1-phosphate adenosyltransferase